MKIDTSKLTPELINELSRDENVKQILINNGVVKNELEFKANNWYGVKWNDGDIDLFLCESVSNDKIKRHNYFRNGNILKIGIDEVKKIDLLNDSRRSVFIPTPQEVETALKNEAVKKYKVGDKIKNHQGEFILENLDIIYNNKYNDGIYVNQGDGVWLMMNGIWAEIIPQEETYIKIPLSTITLTDSKKKLGKIVKNLAKNV